MDTPDSKPGDVFIQIKTGGKGHTGFVVSVSEDGKSIENWKTQGVKQNA